MSTSTDNVNHNPPPHSYSAIPPNLTIVITIVILVFLFVGLFSLYFCRCLVQNLLYLWHGRSDNGTTTAVGPTASSTPKPGLDAAIIARFPTFTYSKVKEYRRERYGLECAICLLEFEDEHVLRLIRICSHVFHQECIDLWFEMHKTCPVCRRNLDVLAKSVENTPGLTFGLTPGRTPGLTPGRTPMNEEVAITVKEDQEEKKEENYDVFGEKEANFGEHEWYEKIARSNTTGHSVFMSRDEEDKFTLILPDHVTDKLIQGNHWPKSCYTSGELKGNMRFFGEGSGGNNNV